MGVVPHGTAGVDSALAPLTDALLTACFPAPIVRRNTRREETPLDFRP